jgi:hypothetical protein
MSRVLSAKLTDKHLSNDTLIYFWSTICIYALFAYDPRQCCLLPIIPLWSPSVGTSESARPKKKPRTLITLKCLDTSVLNTDKNHLITLTLPLDIHSNIFLPFLYNNKMTTSQLHITLYSPLDWRTTVSLKQHSVDRRITDHSSTTVVLPQLHQEMVVLERYAYHSFRHVVSTLVLGRDRDDFNESLIVGVPEVVVFHMEVPGAACEAVSCRQQVSSIVVFENSCMYRCSDLLRHEKRLDEFQD